MTRTVVDAVHTSQLQEHGGLQGTRDDHAVDSALARPRNKFVHDTDADLADLAGAYAFALARSHPYVDGNKRTAYLTAAIFLDLNGLELDRSDKEIVDTMRALAAGSITERKLARWIRTALVPATPPGSSFA